MRIVLFLLSAIVCIGLVITLNVPLPANGGKTPRLGNFLSPQKGFWQNAEAANQSFNGELSLPGLKGNADVYFDERLVPHVYAEYESDVFYIQGYLHAKFRLWQMDFQTHIAAGRFSEIMGDSANGRSFLGIDKFFRRLGMVYAAENSLKDMEKTPEMKLVMDAYTAGVNAYITALDESSYPLEYKLLDYAPEPWTNLKSALFLKFMSFDLAAYETDFEHTNAKSYFTKQQYEMLYPVGHDSLDPIIPKGTLYDKPAYLMLPPATADSLYFNYKMAVEAAEPVIKPNKNNGSNNWAVDGSKTKSGKPILCNDPHLGLNLPSLWYEMQLSTPQLNTYGATFPGAPCVVIGFNDSCSWGFTNSERDVRDYYQIKFKDESRNEYLYNGEWKKTEWRDEIIYIKGKAADTEHIAMTVWGPVMYDAHYKDKLNSGNSYAVRWKAHDVSNELLTFYKMNYAKNYDDYTEAISTYQCPAQNMIFACNNGDIAIKQQGQFPAKWYRQGEFIMPGYDSSYAWRGYINDTTGLMMHNPSRGFVSSANQYPYDPQVYPYYMNGSFALTRGIVINKTLTALSNITAEDMENLQKNNYNLLAQWARPLLLKYTDVSALNATEQNFLDIFKNWNLYNNPEEKGATVFKVWWGVLMEETYGDEFAQSGLPLDMPDETVLFSGLAKDSAYAFADNINTPDIETDKEVINISFKKAADKLLKAENDNMLEWSKFKGSGVFHLLHIAQFSRENLTTGGGDGIVNAYTKDHGPSWKMVVEMTDKVAAFGIYPGGQSGNPGSKFYDSFIDDYLGGTYYPLLFTSKEEMAQQNNIKGKVTFKKS